MKKDIVKDISEELTRLYSLIKSTEPTDASRAMVYTAANRLIGRLPESSGKNTLVRMFDEYKPMPYKYLSM
jgi:hypothetical protein